MNLQRLSGDNVFEEAHARGSRRPGDFGLKGRVLLADVIENGVEPPEELEPGLLLKGAVHHIFAGPSCGKTWLALFLMKNAIERGQRVAFFDTENGLRIVAERLKELGADVSVIDDYFWYFPSLSLVLGDAGSFAEFLDAVKPGLIVFDSWLDHLASAGLSENESTDIAAWAACYSRPARNRGCTVVILDHVPHDGARYRGSTRKKDECDVQWRLTNPKQFDRLKVGEIKLRKEKDREAALPQEVRFKVGGSENGFVFEGDGQSIGQQSNTDLSKNQRRALQALESFEDKGATFTEWWHASGIEAKSTFCDVLNQLDEDTFAKHEDRYFASCETNGLGGPAGHAPDKAGHPSGTSGQSGGSYRPPDRAPKTVPDPEIRNQELGEPSLDDPAVDQDVGAFLQNPPQWWRELIAAYRGGLLNGGRLNVVASEVAYAIYGSPHRWREVLPAIRDAVKHTNGSADADAGG